MIWSVIQRLASPFSSLKQKGVATPDYCSVVRDGSKLLLRRNLDNSVQFKTLHHPTRNTVKSETIKVNSHGDWLHGMAYTHM